MYSTVYILISNLLRVSLEFHKTQYVFYFCYRDEARDMFYHAYHAYMENAFPADELMPLSCRGRFRGMETNRGDIDDALGK